jgi:DegV family protein with EDD domain
MPNSLIDKYRVAVLPLQVIIGEKSYRDGCDIKSEQLYEVMRQGVVPKTSQINIAETESLFRSICEAGDDLIYLCFSSGMSGTHQVAQMVVEKLQGEFTHLNMVVVDSEGGGLATGLIAMQTARWIADGKQFNTIVSLMKEMVAQVQHLFTVDSLKWLVKGGRLHSSAGYIGDKLQIKPILNIVDKTAHIMKIARGRKAAMRTIVQTFLEKTKDFTTQLVGIQHADNFDSAKQIEQIIFEKNPKAKTIVLPIGCVLASHIGVRGVGLFFFKKSVPGYDLLSETGI